MHELMNPGENIRVFVQPALFSCRMIGLIVADR